MIHKAHDLKKRSLRARDGVIGSVIDLYFDDEHWVIRYLVVETGSWLDRKSVLISPGVAGCADWTAEDIPVDLTMDEVRHSPPLESDEPPSEQYEAALREYYGWAPYALPMAGIGGVVPPATAEIPSPADLAKIRQSKSHLRSVEDTRHYSMRAIDGAFGYVDDFLIDDDFWRIRYLVVDTRKWLPGRKVLVAPAWLRSVDWVEGCVLAELGRKAIEASPPYDATRRMDKSDTPRLHEHYRRPPYSDWEGDVAAGAPPKSKRKAP